MSQAEMIKEQQILKRRVAMTQARADAKSALRALHTDVAYAQDKGIENVDTTSIESHLSRFKEKQCEYLKLSAEIAELEY